MKKLLQVAFAVITSSILLFSCQKELSVETGATLSNPAGPGVTASSWQFTGTTTTGGTNYSGCIDTAFYATINNASFLRIEGSDAGGNFFYMLITAPNGKAAKGTYTASQGQSMMAAVIGTKNYTINTNGVNFKAEITDISDTSVAVSFSGKLIDPSTNTNFEITAGKLKALISKENICNPTSTPPPTTTNAVFTLAQGTGGACGNALVSGTYQTNNAVTSAEKVTLSVNVTTAGAYNIQTTATNGLTFSGSGSLSTGAQTIILQASGTPTNVGDITIPVTAGSSSCSFTVNVSQGTPAAPNAWSFTEGSANYGGTTDSATILTQSGQKFLVIDGATASGDTVLTLAAYLPTGVVEQKTYTAQSAFFYFDDYSVNPSKTLYESDPQVAGATVAITVTKYDQAGKTVEGTFTGKAKDKNGTLKDITNGKFKAKFN